MPSEEELAVYDTDYLNADEDEDVKDADQQEEESQDEEKRNE